MAVPTGVHPIDTQATVPGHFHYQLSALCLAEFFSICRKKTSAWWLQMKFRANCKNGFAGAEPALGLAPVCRSLPNMFKSSEA